jgi:branched-chain amino acid aminotransferase
MERFIKSGDASGIDIRKLLFEIEKRAWALLSELYEPNAALRIVVTRGSGKLHIDWRTCPKPEIYMAAWRFDKANLPETLRLAVTKIRRNDIRALDPAIKSGNYLNSVLAFKEAVERGFDDAILLNPQGMITELTTMNLGWVAENRVYTPSTDCGILHGVTRKVLLQVTDVNQGQYKEDALRKADEVFVLSTFKEVLPVSAISFEDGQIIKYEKTQKTLELQKMLRSEIERRLAKESPVF